MGQKTHPTGFRLGISKTWSSKWFSSKDYDKHLEEDIMLRRYVNTRLEKAGVARVEIERRTSGQVTVNIHTARPGVVIGRKGVEVDKLRDELKLLTKKNVFLNIQIALLTEYHLFSLYLSQWITKIKLALTTCYIITDLIVQILNSYQL